MRKIKSLISILISVIIAGFVVGCKKDTNDTLENKDLYGIAIYQNSNENTNWSTYEKKPNKLTNLISTVDGKISYPDEPEFLFFVYSSKPINDQTNNYISNVTFTNPEIIDNTLTISMEKIRESTCVLICYIYKNKDNFTLEFIQKETMSADEDKSFELNIDNPNFNKIKLNLKINLSTKKEY